MSGLINGTTQVRAPLRGSARRAAGVNPSRAWPGLTNAATPSMAPHSQANRALLCPSGVRAQGAVGAAGTVPLARMSHKFEKRCEARQNEIRAGSVLAHVTKRVAAITPPRALVVLRFLLNNLQNTLCIWPKLTTCSHPNSYTRSAETGEIFGLALPCSGRKIAPACEVQFMTPDTTARDQAGRSDNTASRACRFEVSAEHLR